MDYDTLPRSGPLEGRGGGRGCREGVREIGSEAVGCEIGRSVENWTAEVVHEVHLQAVFSQAVLIICEELQKQREICLLVGLRVRKVNGMGKGASSQLQFSLLLPFFFFVAHWLRHTSAAMITYYINWKKITGRTKVDFQRMTLAHSVSKLDVT